MQFQSLESRLLLSADLIGAVLWDPADPLVPGDQEQATVVVQNVGDATIRASVMVNVYASADNVVDASDVLLDTGQTAGRLVPGASKSVNLDFDMPSALLPGAYSLLAVVDPANTIPEGNETNNVATGDAFNFRWMFGEVPGHGQVALTLRDADGTDISFSLIGAGTGEITVANGEWDLVLTGTTGVSELSILTLGGGDGRVELDDVHVFGPLNVFIATTTDLIGTLAIDGAVKNLSLGTVQGGLIAVASVQVLQADSLTNSMILIGANLGADGQLGGTGADADSFSAGSLGLLKINGPMTNSSVRVGVDPVDGIFGNGNDVILGGASSSIGTIIISGPMSADSRIIAGAFPARALINGQNLVIAGDPRFSADVTGPTLAAALAQDTGGSASDGLTNDPAIAGNVDDPNGIATFVAGFTATPTFDILADRQADGSFTLTSARLAQINGAPLTDGSYTLTLEATDPSGNPSQTTVTFTLDTTVTQPIFDLAAASDTQVVGDQQTTTAVVTLVGQTEPNALVELLGQGLTTTADLTGLFTFANVALALGANAFTARATDAAGNQETLSRTITRVAEPTLDPIGDRVVDEQATLTFQVTASDPDTPPEVLTFSLTNAPAGAAIDPGTGVFNWTPTEAHGPGNYTFDVLVTDNGTPGLVDIETITVTVNEVNQAPILNFNTHQLVINRVTVVEGDTGTTDAVFTVTLSDAAPVPVMVDFATLDTTATAGSDYVATSGTLSFLPGERIKTFAVSVLGDTASEDYEHFGVTLSEAVNATISVASGVAQILDNDAPLPRLVIDPAVVFEGDTGTTEALFTVTLSAATSDTVTVNFATTPHPSARATAGSDYVPTAGSLTFEPGVTVQTFTVLVVGDTLDESIEEFVVTLSSAVNATILTHAASGTIVDDELLDISTVSEGEALNFFAVATDPDLPPNSLTFTLDAGAPAGASIDPVTGLFAWTPTEAQGPGVYSITIRVTDDGTPALSDAETILVTVNEVNLAPVLAAIGDRSVNEGELLAFTALATDPDLPANTLTFSLDPGAPTGAAIDPNAGVFSWTPSEAEGPGLYPITVRVTDNGSPALDDFETIAVTVNEVNLAPLLAPIGDKSVNEGEILLFLASATDADIPLNTLIFSLGAGAPAGAAIDPNTGFFSWTPTEAQGPGDYPVTIRVTDNGSPALADFETITVHVAEVNLAPVLDPIGNRTINEAQLLSFLTFATDAETPLGGLTFSLQNAPVGAAITPAFGEFSWTPTEAQGPGTYTFDVVVTDDGSPALSDSETITVTVNEVNLPPTLSLVPGGIISVSEDSQLRFTLAAIDAVDLPANSLTFSLDNAPVGAVIDSIAIGSTTFGEFTWSPTEAQGPATYDFAVVVTDDGSPAMSDARSITVVVNEVNVAPVVNDQTFSVAENSPNGTVLGTIAASDPDLPANALTYALTGSLAFAVNSATGEITVANSSLLDFETTPTFALTATVTDAGNLSDTAMITINLTDVDEVSLSIDDVTVSEGNSGTTNAIFTVTLSGPSTQLITVVYATANDTAEASSDYVATSSTLTFAPGETTKTITVAIKGDTAFGPDETFFVNLSASTNATIADGQGRGTILDDDPLPTLRMNEMSVTEGDSGTRTINVVVNVTGVSEQDIFVDFATADGTALAGSDYVAITGTLTIPAGSASGSFSVSILGDTVVEADVETFFVNLSNAINAAIADGQTVIDVRDQDAIRAVSINNVSVAEGNPGTTARATFSVFVGGEHSQEITVDFATADGTAIAGQDYVARSGTLTFAPGSTQQSITVDIIEDSRFEANETFVVNLSNPINSTLGDAQGVATISNDDPAPSVSIFNASSWTTEGDSGTTNAVFLVALSNISGLTTTVDFATVNGTAAAGTDYTFASGTLNFAPGETSKEIVVAVNGDTTEEADETFFVNLSNAVNATIGDGQGMGMILNEDPLPTLRMNEMSVTEGDSGTRTINVVVNVTGVSEQDIFVDFATADGTALAGSDYVAITGTLTIPAGSASGSFSVSILGDTTVEPNETFFVNLSNAINATIADGQTVIEVRENDIALVTSSGVESAPGGSTPTSSQIESLFQASIALWTDRFGEEGARLAFLNDVSIDVADLPGAELGRTEGNSIWIDADAAGHGWFVDVSPADNSEFSIRLERNVFGATRSSEAFGRMDLLTVVTHEIGHVLRFDHDDAALYTVMRDELDPGARYVLDGSDLDVGRFGVIHDRSVSRRAPSFDFGDASGTQGCIDWQAPSGDGWGVRLSPYSASKPASQSSNFADFLVKLFRSDRVPAGDANSVGYDQLGSTLLKGGKPSRPGKGLF